MTATKTFLWVACFVVTAVSAFADYIDHDFDALFTYGQSLSGQNDWTGDAAVVVTNDPVVGQTDDAAYLPMGTAISNNIDRTPATTAWTECRIRPVWGAAPDDPSGTGASFALSFSQDGFPLVWNGGAWQECTNDIWGNALSSLTGTTAWVEIAICQNFTSKKGILFLNGRAVLQDIPFPNAQSDYNNFIARNTSETSYLEDVRVQTSYDAARLSGYDYNSRNGDDATEADTYGYVGRTIDVGPGKTYTTLSNALAVYRYPLDLLEVYADDYAETITLTQNVVFAGQSFTSTAFTVAAGYTATFNQDVTLTTLTGNGDVTLGSGVNLIAATVDLNGTSTLTLNSGADLDSTTLTMEDNTMVDVTSGDLAATGDDVDMSGTFTIAGSDWGTAATVGELPFDEEWDVYASNSKVTGLGFRGWGASSDTILVQTDQYYAGGKSAILPSSTIISNRLAVSDKKIWTDCRIRPVLGPRPSDAEASTAAAAFACYADTNGYLNVATASGWVTCTKDVMWGAAPTLSDSAWTRLTFHLDFDEQKFAVFVDGTLVKEQMDFKGSPSTYANLVLKNKRNNAYLDNVHISSTIPADMTQDIDHDGLPDAYEIHTEGVAVGLFGTILWFN